MINTCIHIWTCPGQDMVTIIITYLETPNDVTSTSSQQSTTIIVFEDIQNNIRNLHNAAYNGQYQVQEKIHIM